MRQIRKSVEHIASFPSPSLPFLSPSPHPLPLSLPHLLPLCSSSQRMECCRCRYDCLGRRSSCRCSESTKGEYAYRADGRLTDAMLSRWEGFQGALLEQVGGGHI